MPPATLAPAARPPSGRYLSFADREDIALWRVQGHRQGVDAQPGPEVGRLFCSLSIS
jgi:hypothetical protein